MSKYDGGPAFPRPSVWEVEASGAEGMSLRDWFAGMALSGWYTNTGMLPHESNINNHAAHFYKMADAMLSARNNHNEQ